VKRFLFPLLRLAEAAAGAATSVFDRLLAVDVIAATGSRMMWDVLDGCFYRAATNSAV